jgi:hypothetical protein
MALAAIAARIATLKDGQRADFAQKTAAVPILPVSREQAAELLKYSARKTINRRATFSLS